MVGLAERFQGRQSSMLRGERELKSQRFAMTPDLSPLGLVAFVWLRLRDSEGCSLVVPGKYNQI